MLVERVLEPTLALALVRTSHKPALRQPVCVRRRVSKRLSKAGATTSSSCASTATCSRSSMGRATCRCRPTSRTPTARPTPSATRRSTPRGRVQLRRRPRVFTSRPTCWTACMRAASQQARLTLHVGAGTFQPVRSERLAEHRMHTERYEIPDGTADAVNAARRAGRRVVAVGTTSLRALESAARDDGVVRAGGAETALFITPGYRFRVVDRLITNFHLPKSTLLMLVSAFAGVETIRQAYAHAIAARYRFFSYGDAMLLGACAMSARLRAARQRRRRAARPPDARPRDGRDAGIHAGRHLRHREGDGADRTRRGRRADRARQHLPPVAAAGPRRDRRARRTASFHGLGRGRS